MRFQDPSYLHRCLAENLDAAGSASYLQAQRPAVGSADIFMVDFYIIACQSALEGPIVFLTSVSAGLLLIFISEKLTAVIIATALELFC